MIQARLQDHELERRECDKSHILFSFQVESHAVEYICILGNILRKG